MVENIVLNIFILTAGKNYTSNFADIPFGPDYCSSSNPSLTAPSISTIFQCIFKIFQIIVYFSKIAFFSFLKFFQIQTYEYQNVPTFPLYCLECPLYISDAISHRKMSQEIS